MNAKEFIKQTLYVKIMDVFGTSPRQKLCKGHGKNSSECLAEDSCSALKEDVERKSSLNPLIQGGEKSIKNDGNAQTQAPQKNKLFRGGKKLTRNLWTSMDGIAVKKNRVLKSEKSMDDVMFLAGSATEKTVDRGGTNLDTVVEDVDLESFNAKRRRGSICEELEKEILDQGGMSLHEMRKAMVIEETLKERFLM